MFYSIRSIILFCIVLPSASASAFSFSNLDDCLLHAVECRAETFELLNEQEQGGREWYMLMYYNLSARWELENLSIPTAELADYANLDNAPDVFRIVVSTIYAKKLLTEGETDKGSEYVQLARKLIINSSERLPDPRRLAELINLYNYLEQYEKANEVALWAIDKTAHIRNPYAKAPLNLSIGHVAWFLGDYPRAVEYYGYAVEANKEMNEPLGLAYGQINLAMVYRELGELDNARSWLEKAVQSMDTAVGSFQAKDKFYIKLRLIELDILQGKKDRARTTLATISASDIHDHHISILESLQQQLK